MLRSRPYVEHRQVLHASGELLLSCLGDGPASGLPWPTAPPAWDDLTREALRHGLAPLLYRRVRSLSPELAPPPEVLERLRDLYLHNELRNTSVYAELARVLGALKDAGVEVIVLKGAFLAEVVYGEIALRPMQDIDLLFRPSELGHAQTVLRTLGYEPPQQDAWQVEELRHCHLPPVTRSGSLPIEAHWTTVGPSPISPDLQDLWSTARPTEVAGVPVLTLSPEHLLHYLCLHVSCQHGFRVPLLQLHDIAAVVRRYPALDWDEVHRIVRAHGSGRFVHVVLSLVRRAFPADIPSAQLERFEESGTDAALVDTAWACLTGSRRREFPRLFVQLSELPGTRARIRHLWTQTLRVRERIGAENQLAPTSLRAHWHLSARVLAFLRRRIGLAAEILLGRSARASLATAADWAVLERWTRGDDPQSRGHAGTGVESER